MTSLSDINADLQADMNVPLTHEMATLTPQTANLKAQTGPQQVQRTMTAEEKLAWEKYYREKEAYDKYLLQQ